MHGNTAETAKARSQLREYATASDVSEGYQLKVSW